MLKVALCWKKMYRNMWIVRRDMRGWAIVGYVATEGLSWVDPSQLVAEKYPSTKKELDDVLVANGYYLC